MQVVDASPSHALVEAPAGLLSRPERLTGSLCIFPFEAAGYPIGPLRRRIAGFWIRSRSERKVRMVLLFD